MVSASKNSVVDLADLSIGTSLSEDYAELLHVRPIIEAINEENDLGYTYEQLNGMIDISTVEDTRYPKNFSNKHKAGGSKNNSKCFS